MEWFTTWDVPEYREWAAKTEYGYLLIIIKQEKTVLRCARAKLLFLKDGLPEFQLLDEMIAETVGEAEERMNQWKLAGMQA